MDQQVYSCCHNFLTVTQSKNTPIGKFHAVKIAKSVFLDVFTVAIQTYPLEDMANRVFFWQKKVPLSCFDLFFSFSLTEKVK